MAQGISGPLRNWSARQWKDATGWITKKDGSAFSTGEALKAEFQRLHSLGIEVIPCQECDNFDPKHGCQGHVKEAEADAEAGL